eukprot:COSAG01_NODE_24114_length_790_cov_0.872648_1_plen_97_part_00
MMLRTPSRYTRSGEARQDPAKLFARFDKDSSGALDLQVWLLIAFNDAPCPLCASHGASITSSCALDLQEFMAAVRKGGRIGASVIADREPAVAILG